MAGSVAWFLQHVVAASCYYSYSLWVNISISRLKGAMIQSSVLRASHGNELVSFGESLI